MSSIEEGDIGHRYFRSLYYKCSKRTVEVGKRAGDDRPAYAIVLTAVLACAIAALWLNSREATTAAAAKPGPSGLCADRWSQGKDVDELRESGYTPGLTLARGVSGSCGAGLRLRIMGGAREITFGDSRNLR